jgi:putative redox protein
MKNTAHLNLETVSGEGMRFSVDTSSKSFLLDTGEGSVAPSPMQAVLAAVGGCTGMDVIGILRKMRQNVTGYELVVEAERSEEHPKVFTSIEVVHRVTGVDLNPAMIERAIELSDTRYCSVHAMLAPSVRMTSRYEIVPAGSVSA